MVISVLKGGVVGGGHSGQFPYTFIDMYPIDGAHLIFTVLSELAFYVFISLCSEPVKISNPVTSPWHKAPPCYKYFMHKKAKKAKKIVPHKGSTVLNYLKTNAKD
jgi:hypothetical protein